jgi:hypothetical protein
MEAVAVSVDEPAASGPSLDLGKNNSTSPETPESEQYSQSTLAEFAETGETGDGRYDCRRIYSNFYFENDDPESDVQAPYRCNQWACYCCGYRMRQNLVEEIQRVCSERPELSRLLTLTLDPEYAPDDQEQQHAYITERWNALRTAISREIGEFSYIWVREEQDSGLPHLHILVSRFLPQGWLSRRWEELDGGEIVDIRRIERVEKAAHYIGKYLTKSALTGMPDGIRRYGSSQDIDLEVRGTSDGDDGNRWDLLMDDYHLGEDEPLTRGVSRADHVEQRENGGPLGKGKGPPTD